MIYNIIILLKYDWSAGAHTRHDCAGFHMGSDPRHVHTQTRTRAYNNSCH